MAVKQSIFQRVYRTFASVRTGITLLILVAAFSAIGTFVLQRPLTDPDKLERSYSPETLRILDAVGLTDVFHAWWFALLLALVSVSIICASLERWPNAWRFYARPYRKPEPHFRAVLPHKTELPAPDSAAALNAAEKALQKLGWKAERIVDHDEVSLYVERHRFSVMAVYIVHLSLLLIFLGGIIDAVLGYRGFIGLVKGETGNVIELRQGGNKTLPFSIACYDTGQENYPDGTPKRWWSKLGVVRDGQLVKQKEIVVNDPLTYAGITFYQSSFGMTGDLEFVRLTANPVAGGQKQRIELGMNKSVQLDPQTTVRLVEFIPDFFVRDKQIFRRSNNPVNPAFRLAVSRAGEGREMWLFPAYQNLSTDPKSPYLFSLTDDGQDPLAMLHYTGLQVSHEPGQWSIWAGCLLMFAGLGVAFYMAHIRFWIMPVRTPEGGTVLWIGGAANKNRDRFERKYAELVAAIRQELGLAESEAEKEQAASLSV